LEVKTRNDEKWLVTFADLMSLLFALFVLINSFSEIDADSFKKNAGPMSQAFNGNVKESDITYTKQKEEPEVVETEIELKKINSKDDLPDDPYLLLVEQTKFLKILRVELKNEIKNKNWIVAMRDGSIFISMPGDTVFLSGSAKLTTGVKKALERMVVVLSEARGSIEIIGHTDDAPISTSMFPSNWVLSSARASSVATYLLLKSRIRKSRISVVGRADTQPVSENREENRRIEIKVM
jgi:chemotaxis protein MotB